MPGNMIPSDQLGQMTDEQMTEVVEEVKRVTLEKLKNVPKR